MPGTVGVVAKYSRFMLFLIYSAYVLSFTGIMALCLKWSGVEFSLDFASDYVVTFGYFAVCAFVVLAFTFLSDVREADSAQE